VMAMVRANLGITVAPRSHLIEGVSAIQLEGFIYHRSIALILADNWLKKFGPGHMFLTVLKNEY